jgi:hypothetical protein
VGFGGVGFKKQSGVKRIGVNTEKESRLARLAALEMDFIFF